MVWFFRLVISSAPAAPPSAPLPSHFLLTEQYRVVTVERDAVRGKRQTNLKPPDIVWIECKIFFDKQPTAVVFKPRCEQSQVELL